MQKLDFVKRLEHISHNLGTERIMKEFDAAFISPSQNYNFTVLKPLLFSSKSNFDLVVKTPENSEIIENLGVQKIYSEDNLAKLVSTLRSTKVYDLLTSKECSDFYKFHLTLFSTLNLAKKFLIENSYYQNSYDVSDNGILVFEVVSDLDSEGIEKYIRVLTLISELGTTVYDIEEKKNGQSINETENSKIEIVLLDSGSSTNIGIKSGIEVAKSLFLIFKEIWDWIVNRKYYKSTLDNNALLESLSIREKLSELVDKKIITEEEEKKYLHYIKTRTDDLIGLKVLPKKLVEEKYDSKSRNLLKEASQTRLLGSTEES